MAISDPCPAFRPLAAAGVATAAARPRLLLTSRRRRRANWRRRPAPVAAPSPNLPRRPRRRPRRHGSKPTRSCGRSRRRLKPWDGRRPVLLLRPWQRPRRHRRPPRRRHRWTRWSFCDTFASCCRRHWASRPRERPRRREVRIGANPLALYLFWIRNSSMRLPPLVVVVIAMPCWTFSIGLLARWYQTRPSSRSHRRVGLGNSRRLQRRYQ
mmetsp:Transcript_32116/g.94527  ORF Transcript_32116/g.94527 Transcript_32116/m.94527 type:complete len:211 (+) Transcript_32116:526-1158(+)